MKVKILALIIINLLLILIGLKCIDKKEVTENVKTEYSIFQESEKSYEMIDYDEVAGEQYYFYMVVDSFLKSVDEYMNSENEDTTICDYFWENSVALDYVDKLLETGREKGLHIEEYDFVEMNQTEDTASFLPTEMQVSVVITFSYDNDNTRKYRRLVQFTVEKYIEEENIFWKIDDIELVDLEGVNIVYNYDEESTVSENVMQAEYPSNEQYDIMIEMIKNGDFSCLDTPDTYVEETVKISDYTEWVVYDIDKDGFDELILQDKEPVAKSQVYRIKAIFTYRPNGMHCVEVDFNDGTEYYFLGENGNLIYCSMDYLADENFGIYICNKINELGEMQAVYRLKIICKDQHTSFVKSIAVEESDGNEWEVMHLTREEFLIAYEELMGVAFEDPKHYFGY